MTDMKYSRDHEWVFLDENGNAVIGISDFAQKQLGDIVYIELPETGRQLTQGEEAAVVESVKAASDVKSPLAGKVIEINDILVEQPEVVNSEPESTGWFIKLVPDDPAQMNDLMDSATYAEFIAGQD